MNSRRADYPAIFRGDTIGARTFTITEDGSPVDLTTITVRARFKLGSTTVEKTAGAGITVTDAAGGVFQLAAFALTDSGAWRYDVQLEYADGTIRTIVWGIVEVVGDA